MSETQHLERQTPTPEPGVEELRHQLESARQQLETELSRVGQMEISLQAQREQLNKEVAARQNLETLLRDSKSQHADAENRLKEKTTELEALKARRFKPNNLAMMVIGLFLLLVLGAVVTSYYALRADMKWWQACSLLGLYLICSAFAAVSIRLLADRCK